MFKISGEEMKKAEGNYILIYMEEQVVAKVKEINEKEGKMIWEGVVGEREGRTFVSRYDKTAKNIEVYEEDEAAIALLK
jgi:hypothetical protein